MNDHDMPMWPWNALGLEAPADERSVRRAYAQRLKQQRPEDDPDAFQRLRAAYEQALILARIPEATEQSPIANAGAETHGPLNASTEGTTAAVGAFSPRVYLDTADIHRSSGDECDDEPRTSVNAVPTADSAHDASFIARNEVPATVRASQVWNAFVADRSPDEVGIEFEEMFNGELDIAVREALELHALRFCANPDVPANVCDAITDTLAWRETGAKHLAAQDPRAFLALDQRLRVIDFVKGLLLRYPTAVAHMAGGPRGRLFSLFAISNVDLAHIGQVIASLRQAGLRTPVLWFEPEQIPFWEQQIDIQQQLRGAVSQGVMFGLFHGFILAFVLFLLGVKALDLPHFGSSAGVPWLVCMLGCCVARIAIVVIGQSVPGDLRASVDRLRSRRAVRFGWIGLWAAGSAAAFAFGEASLVPASIAMVIASEWGVFAHGRFKVNQAFFANAAFAFGMGIVGHFVFERSSVILIAMMWCVLYGIYRQDFDTQIRDAVQARPGVHKALSIAWVACAVVTGVALLVTIAFGIDGAWSAYALLMIAVPCVAEVGWPRRLATTPVVVWGWLLIIANTLQSLLWFVWIALSAVVVIRTLGEAKPVMRRTV